MKFIHLLPAAGPCLHPSRSCSRPAPSPPPVQSPTSHHGFCSTTDHSRPGCSLWGPGLGQTEEIHRANPPCLVRAFHAEPSKIVSGSVAQQGQWMWWPCSKVQDQLSTWASLEKCPRPFAAPIKCSSDKCCPGLNGWLSAGEQTHQAAGVEGPGGLR